MNKIFGIGLSKTGTNSLCEALAHLGIIMVHYPSKDYVTDINNNDGACDLPITARYKEIDKLYPGSKFIYTIRDEESWHTSVKKHFVRRPTSTLGKWGRENRIRIYGSLYPDEVDFLERYRAHATDVREYFSERYEDLLILDVSKDDAWERLASFVGKETPENLPFPVSNKAPEKLPIMDAVYPYIVNPEGWDELRYSLRSLEQNFTNLRNVWIVGDKPEWANDKINMIPRSTEWSGVDTVRNKNYCGAILTAALHDEISEDFLCINDDHYLLCPLRIEDIASRPLIREDMSVYTPEERATANKSWQILLWYTYDRLKSCGFSGYNFENHVPVVVNKNNIAHCMGFMGYGDGKLMWKTAYFNMFPPPSNRAHLSESTDLKAGFYGISYTEEEVVKKIKDAIYLSHNDDGLSDFLKKKIPELFPNPSSFEKA